MRLLIILFLVTFSKVTYSANTESISHSHDGRVHSHPLPESGKNHKHNQGGNNNKKASISHSHNGRVHSHPLPKTGKNHTHNSKPRKKEENNNLDKDFPWLNHSGWVTVKDVCLLLKKHNPEEHKNIDCRTYKLDTLSGGFLTTWAGEPIKVYYDKNDISNSLFGNSKFQIKVTWTTGDLYKCGQILTRRKKSLAKFTHRSIMMRKCP